MKKAFEMLLINIANLFKIKSILTLTVIWTVSYLIIKGLDIPPEYAAFAGSIITYFFTKAEKKEE